METPDSTNTGRLAHPLPTLPNTPTNSGYGMRFHPVHQVNRMHHDVDMRVAGGTRIGALDGGEVMFAGTERSGGGEVTGAGNYVIVRHGTQDTGYLYSASFHAQDRSTRVVIGSQVTQGQTLARVGSTGSSTGPHLHLEYFEGGREDLIRQGSIGGSGARRLNPSEHIGREYISRITIRQGDRNDAVEALQQRLVNRGYDLRTPGQMGNGVDGSFGGSTQTALVAFQRDRGMTAAQQTGVYGPATRAEMAEAAREGWRRSGAAQVETSASRTGPSRPEPAAPETTPRPAPAVERTEPASGPAPSAPAQRPSDVLRENDRGPRVEAMQQDLAALGYPLGTTGRRLGAARPSLHHTLFDVPVQRPHTACRVAPRRVALLAGLLLLAACAQPPEAPQPSTTSPETEAPATGTLPQGATDDDAVLGFPTVDPASLRPDGLDPAVRACILESDFEPDVDYYETARARDDADEYVYLEWAERLTPNSAFDHHPVLLRLRGGRCEVLVPPMDDYEMVDVLGLVPASALDEIKDETLAWSISVAGGADAYEGLLRQLGGAFVECAGEPDGECDEPLDAARLRRAGIDVRPPVSD